jgi:DnaK suppressor protein
MESGEFGECAECGEPIAERRLEVDPTALLCVSCARGDAR